MDGKELVGVGAQLATVGALLLSLFLLAQGQRDRRLARQQTDEAMARKVTLGVTEVMDQSSPHSFSLESWTLHVRNDADVPVHIDWLQYVWRGFWPDMMEAGQRELHTEGIVTESNFLVPRTALVLERGPNHSGNSKGWRGDPPDFAVIYFRDESGRRWRRRSDSGALQAWPPGIRRWQRVVQQLALRVPGFDTVFLRPLRQVAVWSAFRRGPDRIPHSFKLSRFLWGGWAPGEGDTWLRPNGAPALWGYAELPWTSDDQRGKT